MATTALGSRQRWLTLVAMTVANSMILVDQTAVPLATPSAIAALDGSLESGQWILTANVLPLAALMVFGGRLGDQRGLRRIFLLGTVVFIGSSALAGAALTLPWLITVRITQGVGAALMMPTTMAIVSWTFPSEDRGRALGLMAGASAFFAALGPVLGGMLTEYIDWRAVFWINVPLALIVGVLTLQNTPEIPPAEGAPGSIDGRGVVTFALGIGALTLGLGQGQTWGWSSPETLLALAVGVVGVVAFVMVERHRDGAMISFPLFRHLNFTASNVSQVLAGAIELGSAFLLPYFLLLAVGVGPGAAGLALIPATVPIIVVAPLAGRWFDRVGGRMPLAVGFLVLAASSFALVIGFGELSILALAPGLILQGIGLGIVLTVNDPTGINAVPEHDRGQASGVIDTSEQMGGAIGIAVLTMLFLQYYFHRLADLFSDAGVTPTAEATRRAGEFIMRSEQEGLEQVTPPPFLRDFVGDIRAAHVSGYRFVFVIAGVIALVGAFVTFILVRREDRVLEGRVFSRRSRWSWATSGIGAGVTRKPLPTNGGAPARPTSVREPVVEPGQSTRPED